VPCLLYTHPNTQTVLLYCHGNSEDIGHTAGALRRLRDALKVHAMAVEYPGYGVSPGKPSESGINNDILVVYSFLRGVMNWESKNIILFGYSIGTGPTTRLASRNDVGGLCLVAPYTSIRDMVQEILPKGVGKVAQYLIANRFHNAKEIADVKCPVLFVHGKADSLIPYQHSETLFAKCGSSQKQLYLADTMDHCYDPNEFEAFIVFPLLEFIKPTKGKRMIHLPPYVLARPNSDQLAEYRARDAGTEVASVDEKTAAAAAAKIAAGAAASAASSSGPEWSCELCTFGNSDAWAYCQMCETPRPSNAAGSGKAMPRWPCPLCTFINEPASVACDMCDTPRPAEPAAVPSSSSNSNSDSPSPSTNMTDAERQDRDAELATALEFLSTHPGTFADRGAAAADEKSSADQANAHSNVDDATLRAWECPTCATANKPSALVCVQCTAAAPTQ
jgi:pimeloyl-ACP methyl ester carboxylesterase